ncbi:hypothetical protein ACFE04_001942 [Oxalis oulophora]
MACIILGTKSDIIHCEDGLTWVCLNGLPSDITVKVEENVYHLHKFPLLSRSGAFDNLMRDNKSTQENNCILELHHVPGGPEIFLQVVKFCYGIKIDLTAENVEVNIVTRCIESLAMLIVAEISDDALTDDWWYNDASLLKFHIFRSLITIVGSRGLKPERIAGAVVHYCNKRLGFCAHQEPIPRGLDTEERYLVESIVELLPESKDIPVKFLCNLLKAAISLHAGPLCRCRLERRIAEQLDEADKEDILIRTADSSSGSFYEVDCTYRLVGYFMREEEANGLSPSLMKRIKIVASLVDEYLAEVAQHFSLSVDKFLLLAEATPNYARPLYDGLYHAIDVYLKTHPELGDIEKDTLCRILDCEKLSLEASTHAAQNERLPVRVMIQVIYYEQHRLRTSLSGYDLSEIVGQNQSGGVICPRNSNAEEWIVSVEDLKVRISELEKECVGMKQELNKLRKSKGSWSFFVKRLSLMLKSKIHKSRLPTPPRSYIRT